MRKTVKILSRVSAVVLVLVIGFTSLVPAFGASISGGHRGSQYWGIKWRQVYNFSYTDALNHIVTGKMGSRELGGKGWMNVHYFAQQGQALNKYEYKQRAFCIEPEKGIEGGIEYGETRAYNYYYDSTNEATYLANTGMYAYDNRLTDEKKKLVNYVLANGYGNYVPADKTHVAYWYATQLLIYEVVIGWRNSDFNAPLQSFEPNSCLTVESDSEIPTNNHVPETAIANIQQAYLDIVGWVKLTLKNPSGTSESSSNAPTYTMGYSEQLRKYYRDYSFNDIIHQDLTDNSNFAVKLSELNLKSSDIIVYDSNSTVKVSYTIDKANRRIRFTSDKPLNGSIAVAFKNPRIRGINTSLKSTAGAGLMVIGTTNTNDQAFAKGAAKLIDRPTYLKLKTSNVETVKMKKVSGNTALTNGNSCYSLAGAEYGLYTNAACTSYAGSIYTDANGNGQYRNNSGVVFEAKNLWAKEITPSPGYLLDENIYQVAFSGTYENGVPVYSFTSTEIPENDPITVFLKKQDANTGFSGADLAGAQFRVNFYDGIYTTPEDVASLTPLRSWVFKTDNNGEIHYDTDWLVSGDNLYLDQDGTPCLPNGSLSIQEISAPTSGKYKINDTIEVRPVESFGDYDVNHEPENPFVVNEVPTGGLTIQKTAADDLVEHVWFRVDGNTGYNGGYHKVFETNEDGYIIIQNDPDMYVNDGNGNLVQYTVTELGFANGDGTYTIPARYTPDHVTQTTTIDGDGGVTLKFNNQMPTGMIRIDKSAEDGFFYSVYFQVTGTNGYNNKFVTNNYGTAYARNLPVYDSNNNLITYTVKEIGFKVGSQYKVPDRYQTVSEQYVTFANASINSDNLIRVNFTNDLKLGNIRIHKSADDGDINGIYFKIENNYADKSDALFYVNEIVKTTSGVAELTDLPVFDDSDQKLTYTITELGKKVGTDQYKIPGYYFDVDAQSITLDNALSSTTEVSFENKVKFHNLFITKDATDQQIENIWFHIESSDGEFDDYYATDEMGEIYIEDLYCVDENGDSITYTITEMGVKKDGRYVYPAKYFENEPRTYEGINYVPLTRDDNIKEVEVDFINSEKKANIIVQKVSEDDEVKNIWFRLTALNGAINKVAMTGPNGLGGFNNLDVYDENNQLIEYTVTELGERKQNGSYEIPYRYNPIAPQTITLEYDEYIIVDNTLNFTNTLRRGAVTLKKYDSTNALLSGVQFKLYDSSDNPVFASSRSNGTYTFVESGGTDTYTTTNGKFVVRNLPQGTYYFREVPGTNGNRLPYDKKINFTIEGTDISTLNVNVNVTNSNAVDIETGGIGNTVFYFISAFFAGVSVFFMLKIKKTNKKGLSKMKKRLSRIFVSTLMIMALVITAIPFVSAAELNTNTKGSLTAQCNKPGYTFELFKVATLDVHSANNSYDNTYTPLVPAIANDVKNGDSAAMVNTLDAIATLPSTAVSQGTWTTSATSTTKTWSNLDQGIYYIRPVNYPAGVTSIKGSVVAVPYNDGTQWIYSYSNINLATKVADDVPTTVKTITNSTKGNVNYTDVSLGDTINFEIKSKTAGSSTMKLTEYTVFDIMSKGLTLDKTSFNVALLKADGTKISDVAAANYKVNVTSEADGEATNFNVALTSSYLQGNDFYAANVAYVQVTYNATLNKHAVTGRLGNPNEHTKLEYTNNNGVKSEVEGNDVYVYTYGIEITKTDEAGTKLQGATFKLYTSEANAKADTNSIATGVSDTNGKVEFKNANNEVIKLASGTYYAVETEAPANYNVYGKVITININATYGTTFTNGSYVTNSPENGIATVSVKDTKIVLPETGGFGNYLFYIIGGIGAAVGCAILIIARKRAKSSK